MSFAPADSVSPTVKDPYTKRLESSGVCSSRDLSFHWTKHRKHQVHLHERHTMNLKYQIDDIILVFQRRSTIVMRCHESKQTPQSSFSPNGTPLPPLQRFREAARSARRAFGALQVDITALRSTLETVRPSGPKPAGRFADPRRSRMRTPAFWVSWVCW